MTAVNRGGLRMTTRADGGKGGGVYEKNRGNGRMGVTDLYLETKLG